MKKISSLLLFLLLAPALPGRGQEKVIIDTDFSQVSADNVPLCVKEVSGEADFPLKLMTGTKETISVEPPSTVLGGKEEIKGLKPPYALVTIKPKLPENRKKGEGIFASAGLIWKFPQAPLGAGRYEASWTFLPLSPVRKMKMAFMLMGEKEDGTLVKIEPVSESNEIPLQVTVMSGRMLVLDQAVPLKEDKPNEIKLDFDLGKNSWSAELNGKKVVRNESFPKGYLAQFKKFWVVSLGMGGGGVEEADGAQYAIGPVKLVKLN